MGIGRDNRSSDRSYAKTYSRPRQRARAWVHHYVWERKYIPEHEEYSEECGRVIVEGHYIRYQVEDGGHWE